MEPAPTTQATTQAGQLNISRSCDSTLHLKSEYLPHFSHDVTSVQILGGASGRRGVSPGLGVLDMEGMSIIRSSVHASCIRRVSTSVGAILSAARVITAARWSGQRYKYHGGEHLTTYGIPSPTKSIRNQF